MRIRSLFVPAMAVLALAPAGANEARVRPAAAAEHPVPDPLPDFVPARERAPVGRVDVYRNAAR